MKLHIGDSVYRVQFVSRVPKESKRTLGLCDGKKKIIYIRKGQTPRGMRRTLIHELLHCFEFEYDVPIKHKAIHILELAIEAFLVDNEIFGN